MARARRSARLGRADNRARRRGAPRGFRAYTGTVSVLGVLACVLLTIGGSGVPSDDWRYWLFAALVLAGELAPIDVPRRGGFDRVTVSTAFAFAILLIFGLLPAVVAYAAASAVADAVARVSPLKLVFNAAQYVLSLVAAAGVMALVSDGVPVEALGPALPTVLAGAVVFFVVNHVLAGVAAALLVEEPPLRYLVTDLGFQALSAGFVLALAPIVVASAEASIALVPLCLVPALGVYAGAREAARHAHRAFHDALTDLPNRLLLHERLNRALTNAGETGRAVTLMIVDLDDFKAVNDTLGHAYGDRLLERVGVRLRATLSEHDLIARLGGDEFAVLPAGPVGASAGRAIAERLVTALEEPFDVDGVLLEVRASVGVACFPEHGIGADELLRRADVALYCAKASQYPVALYSAAQDHYTVDRLLLAGQLRRGIDAGEIILEYQPKFPLRGGRPAGVEALARWRHPALGQIGPDGFIALAEQSGHINRLTEEVLRMAIAQSAQWLAAGVDLRMSVNVSPRSLLDPHLPRLIRELLDEYDVDPQGLQLEITESRAVPTGRVAVAVLEELRAVGVGIAIDDFGTGFSSLVQLQRLPVDEIKIDRSFVANMAHSPGDAGIVRSTIDLARNLGLVVTAEGVESEEAREQLAEMGCELAQGYGLCRPLPADRCLQAVLDCPSEPTALGTVSPLRAVI